MRSLNCHSLLTSLDALCRFLDDAYDVNSGGCCFLASIIAKHLDRIGLDYELVIYDSYLKDISSIEYEVINRHRNRSKEHSVTGPYCCNHYCIHLKGAGIINSGCNEYGDKYKYIIPDITFKNIRWIYKLGGWNECYEIRHNKTIKNIVKEFFKEYEKKVPVRKNMYLS